MTLNPETRPLPLRRNSELAVLEDPLEWLRQFQTGWLAHYERTGEQDWARYNRPRNTLAPCGPGIQLARSRILVITTAGFFLRDAQAAFNASDPLGDYTLRLIPSDTPVERLSFAHPELDSAVNHAADLFPLESLRAIEATGFIKQLLSPVVSFMGHQPNVLRTVKELVPAVLAAARQARAHAALLLPASSLCVQTAGLVARALEVNGIASVLVTWNETLARFVSPPRLLVTPYSRRAPLGTAAQQANTLKAALALLEQPGPLPPKTL
ncbi:MAG: hypothetical protein EPO32_06465 [Anaerolineae bacterium]|nr:MAG: hypothetical protein EPO32_06465 [Anaerolineae bacterium]